MVFVRVFHRLRRVSKGFLEIEKVQPESSRDAYGALEIFFTSVRDLDVFEIIGKRARVRGAQF